MSTQRELIYTIKTILRGGLITDDDKLSDRQIAFLIDSTRAVLLRQQYNKGQSLSDNNIQHIHCMPVEETDTSFNTLYSTDCKVYKTVQTIPKPIEAKGKDLITGIAGSEFNGFNYEFVTYARLPYATATKFKRPLAVLYNGYIYLIDAPYTKTISVSGIFEQPNTLSDYDDCAGNACFDWDTPYPLSSHLIDPIIKMVVQDLTLTLKVPQDRTNSGNQAVEPQNKSQEGGV